MVILGLAAGFVLVPLLPALLGRGTLIDVGALSAFLPFRADVGAGYAEVVTCRGDTIDYYLPGIAEIRRSVFAGHFPTWAPYELGGAPLASLPNHGALSPMSLPYFLLPLWLAPAYAKLLEFFVAIAGMVLFLRRLGVAPAAGLLAGVVFAGSGFMLMWTNWPHTRVAALIPGLFWALERLVQELRARDVALVGVILASMLLAGFPAIVLFTLTLAAPYVATRAVLLYRHRRPRLVAALLAPAGGVILGLGLSAVQILPFAANIAAFDFGNRNELGRHLPLFTAFTVIDPYAVGSCVGGQKLSTIVPIEAVGFIGAAVLPLAVAAAVLRRRSVSDAVPTAFFVVAAAVLGSALWFGGPTLAALQVLPLWSTNFIGRAQSVFGFIVAVCAGAGLDRLLRGVVPPSRLVRPPATDPGAWLRAGVAAAVCVGVGAAVTVAIGRVSVDQGFGHHVVATAVVPALLLIGGTAAVIVAARGPGSFRLVSLLVLVVLIIGQSATFAHTLLPTSRQLDFYPETDTHRYLSEHLGADRYGAPGWTMLAATSDFYELRTPVGHEFTPRRWKEAIWAADPGAQRTATYSSFSASLPMERVQRSPALDQLAVKYWVASPELAVGRPEALAVGSGEVPLRVDDAAHCTLPGGPVRGVSLRVTEAMSAGPKGSRPMVHVAVSGGGVERQGSALIDTARGPGVLTIAVAGEDLPQARTSSVRIWLTDADGARTFAGRGDDLVCGAVRPTNDGLRLVRADAGGAIYQRLHALPRIRWASTSRVVTDPKRRVLELRRGVPAETVMIEDDALPVAEGRPAVLTVLSDARERIAVRVDARGTGYLVIADSIVRPGWQATVDGTAVDIQHGNHAFAAIPVREGEHTVELRYVAPGLRAGLLVTIVSALLAAVPVVAFLLSARRRRKPR